MNLMNLSALSQYLTLTLLLLSQSGCIAEAQEAQERQEDPRKLEAQVSKCLSEGRYDEAAKNLDALISIDDQRVDYHFKLGDTRFMNGEMKQAIAAYDRAIELAPALEPRCWQRGLAYYFANEFELGKAQFDVHQTVNSQDVENSVWHLLCNSRLVGLEKARDAMIPIQGDSRTPMPEVFKLFAGQGTANEVMQAATRDSQSSDYNRRNHLYYAHLYIGLFHDMQGESELAVKSMKQASDINPSSKSQLMGSVADVFLKLRDPKNRN